MQEIVLQLEKVQLTKFETKTGIGTFTFNYTKNQEPQSFTQSLELTKAEPIIDYILKALKSLGKANIEQGEGLNNIVVLKVVQEEKIEEQLYNFFAKICEKTRALKRETNHTEYMKLYDDIRIQTLRL
tara:strand:- start:8638 stop:9021 length:384 start_codon:yes stop_codon:yes gene_type:complete